ncbi:MAG: TraB/GumN family protein [Myxococcales bacterium]|nr:TraB/GumN family protein [Myxococcales bacterium]MBK7196550.1 TraB/GumN family protein [Myxococcales bacterium]MBP6849849.1 TraB/GumN family protein [Kofleriaceae bacterium]
MSAVTEFDVHGVPIHLIGTAHVSARSVDEVREVIRAVKPEVVCVELCQGRFDALTSDNAFRNLDVFKVIREGKTLYLLAHLALASYQRKMGQELGVKPGAELLAAIEEAKAVGARVELIDRSIHTTLKRTWANLGLWKRSMLLASLVAGGDEEEEAEADDGKAAKPTGAAAVEAMKEPKALSEMLSELSRTLPEVKTPLIDERDQYLVAGIEDAAAKAKSVVAVVGAAHVPGMMAHRGQPVDKAKLDALPRPGILWTAVKWLIPAFLVFGLVWGALHPDSMKVKDVLMALVLPTSIGAGVLTLFGGGKPLSVLTAVVVAPIAAIHPLLGTAMVVGVVEAWLRKPTVLDCERLPDDVTTLKGFWKNPVSRTLLVAILSGLGTAIGMWVGAAWIATLL